MGIAALVHIVRDPQRSAGGITGRVFTADPEPHRRLQPGRRVDPRHDAGPGTGGGADHTPGPEFPGGKVEPNETPEQALIRELQEELGIDTWESCLAPLTFASHSYEKFHLLMPLFACRKWNGTPESREGQALKWVRVNQLKDYPMPPADEPLVAHLCDLL